MRYVLSTGQPSTNAWRLETSSEAYLLPPFLTFPPPLVDQRHVECLFPYPFLSFLPLLSHVPIRDSTAEEAGNTRGE